MNRFTKALVLLLLFSLSSCSLINKSKSLLNSSNELNEAKEEEEETLIKERALKEEFPCPINQLIPMMDHLLESQTCNLCEVLAFESLINCDNCGSNSLFIQHINGRLSQYRNHIRNICFSKACLEGNQTDFLTYMWQNSNSEIIACMNLMGISTGLSTLGTANTVMTKPLVNTSAINPMLVGVYERFCGEKDFCPRPVGHKCDDFALAAQEISTISSSLTPTNHCSGLEQFTRIASISSDYCSCLDNGFIIELITGENKEQIRAVLQNIIGQNAVIKYCSEPKMPEQGNYLREYLESKRIGCGLSIPMPTPEFVHKFVCNTLLCEPRSCACHFTKAELRCNGAAGAINNRPNTACWNLTNLLTMHALVIESNYCYCPTTTPTINHNDLINKLTQIGAMGPSIATYCQQQQYGMIRQKLNQLMASNCSPQGANAFDTFDDNFISRLCENKFCPDYQD